MVYILVSCVGTAFLPPFVLLEHECVRAISGWSSKHGGRDNLTNYGLCVPQAGIEYFPPLCDSNPTTCGGTSLTRSYSLPWSEDYRKQYQGWLRISRRPVAAFGPRIGPHLECLAL